MFHEGSYGNQQFSQQQAAPQQGTAQWGAHEAMQVHESLSSLINGINNFQLYRPHIRDQQLMSILDRQINEIQNHYQNLTNYVHNQGMHAAEPLRGPSMSSIKYGLHNPSPIQPKTNPGELDDRDVASAMLSADKACSLVCSISSLECADANLRQMVTSCAIACNNMAYEVFQYMNQKGYYQVPTMMSKTTNTMVQSYQPVSNPGTQF